MLHFPRKMEISINATLQQIYGVLWREGVSGFQLHSTHLKPYFEVFCPLGVYIGQVNMQLSHNFEFHDDLPVPNYPHKPLKMHIS